MKKKKVKKKVTLKIKEPSAKEKIAEIFKTGKVNSFLLVSSDKDGNLDVSHHNIEYPRDAAWMAWCAGDHVRSLISSGRAADKIAQMMGGK